MTVGEACRIKIRKLCKEKGITLNKLSIICGITQSTLNNVISGRNKSITVSTVQKICDGLEITISDFFNDDVFRDIEQEIK